MVVTEAAVAAGSSKVRSDDADSVLLQGGAGLVILHVHYIGGGYPGL